MAGVGGVPTSDQRGTGFSRVVGGRIDVGAVENTDVYCSGVDFAAPYGTLNVLDAVEFQSLFLAGSNWADLNNDGVLNFLDFVAFQQIFLQGCS